jgi:Leu/Phe-tRNA-protein transferase
MAIEESMTQPTARDLRISALYKMSKSKLAAHYRRVHPGLIWTAHPLEKWNKDELVNGILHVEFPTAVSA